MVRQSEKVVTLLLIPIDNHVRKIIPVTPKRMSMRVPLIPGSFLIPGLGLLFFPGPHCNHNSQHHRQQQQEGNIFFDTHRPPSPAKSRGLSTIRKINPGLPHQDCNETRDAFSTSLPSRFIIVRVSPFSSALHKDENAQTISTPSSRGTKGQQ